MNLELFNAIHGLAGRSRLVDGIGVFAADIMAYLMVLAAMYFAFSMCGWRQRIFVAAEGILAVLLAHDIINRAIRYFYPHLRPFAALNFTPLLLGKTPDNSFASGHMTIFFALSTIIFCVNRKWGIWFMVLSLLMGLGRIFVGIHWPVDILAGTGIGIFSGLLVYFLTKKYWLQIQNKTNA
jgi:undecaprenyl-diphosphatase